MAILFDEADLLRYVSNKDPPITVLRLLDSLFTLYVSKMKIIFFDMDDFRWMLKVVNACENTSLLNLLQKHLRTVLLNRDRAEENNVLSVFSSEVCPHL